MGSDGLYDDDGNQVEAQRHTNPDGTLGGWVASTAYVSPKSYVGASARIFGYARVLGESRIDGEAVIRGFAVIRDSQILGKVRVSNQALVEGSKIDGEIGLRDRSAVSLSEILGRGHIEGRTQVSQSLLMVEYLHIIGTCNVHSSNVLASFLEVFDRALLTGVHIEGGRFHFEGRAEAISSTFRGTDISVVDRCELLGVVVQGTSIHIGGRCVVDPGTTIQGDNIGITSNTWPLPESPPETSAALEKPVGISALAALLDSDFE